MKLVIACDTFMSCLLFGWGLNKFDNKNRNLLLVYHIICIVQSLYCAALVTVLARSLQAGFMACQRQYESLYSSAV